MRVAGVRCDDGYVVWADARDLHIQSLDCAVVSVAGAEQHGHVFVTPELLVQPPAEVEGMIVHVEPSPDPDLACADLPGSEMPPLGSLVTIEGVYGAVTQLDPVQRTVTVTTDDGVQIVREADALPPLSVGE